MRGARLRGTAVDHCRTEEDEHMQVVGGWGWRFASPSTGDQGLVTLGSEPCA